MKKISVMGLVLAIVLSLNVLSVMGAAVEVSQPLQDVSVLETGTYRITVADDKNIGFFVMNDTNGDTVDYVIVQENDYGYIYFSKEYKGYSYDIKDVNYELVSTEDLGVSGYHVFELVEGDRDFDPVLDTEDNTVYVKDLTAEDMEVMFS